MKMTVITDTRGKLLASVFGHVSRQTKKLGDARHYKCQGEPLATLVCQPGQKFHEIEVPKKYKNLSPDELHEALRKDGFK